MRILFVHCNYPAQFRHLSQHLAANTENEIVFLCQNKEWTANNVPNINLARYQLGREPQGELCHPYLRRYEAAVLHGQAALREALRLRQNGFYPDLIVGHSGFGNTLYLKEVWPNAKFVDILNGFIAAKELMWALATINHQALTQAYECTPTTARSSWIWLNVTLLFAPPIGKQISFHQQCAKTYR